MGGLGAKGRRGLIHHLVRLRRGSLGRSRTMGETPRRVWYWLAPGLILGAAYLGSVFADWLNDKAANTGDITGEVVAWGVVAQLVTVSITTILLVLLEGPYRGLWGAHSRQSVFVYAFGLIFLLAALNGGHTGHLFAYADAQAVAALIANVGVLGLVQRMSRRVAIR